MSVLFQKPPKTLPTHDWLLEVVLPHGLDEEKYNLVNFELGGNAITKMFILWCEAAVNPIGLLFVFRVIRYLHILHGRDVHAALGSPLHPL